MSRSISNSVLPRHIDPRKFAQQGLNLSGSIALHELSRLAGLVLQQQSSIEVNLQFGIDDERHRIISGDAEGVLKIDCQRCLEPVEVPLHAEFQLAIVWTEDDARELPQRLDPLILGEGLADLYTIVEDELLLDLPMVSYHEEDCIGQTSFGDGAVENAADARKNPFQVLEQLKGSPKS